MATVESASHLSPSFAKADRAAARAGEGQPTVAVTVVRAAEEICALWDGIPAGTIATAYQSAGFVRAWLGAGAGRAGGTPLALVVSSAGVPLLWLPLTLERRAGLTIARFIGESHSNHNMPVFDPVAAARLSPETLGRQIRAALAGQGVDAALFDRQPVAWRGHDNPLVAALPGRPATVIAQTVQLAGDFPALVARHNSSSKKKHLKSKEKILSAFGDYRCGMTVDPAQCADLLDVFFQQKAQRLAEQGIADSFASAPVRAFFHALASPAICGNPLLEMAYLTCGGKVRAVIGNAVEGDHRSVMFLSYALDDSARGSPAKILMHRMIEQLAQQGVQSIDFGVGWEAYKESWVDAPLPLVDSAIALSARGRAYLGVIALRRRLELAIRGNARAWEMYKSARRLIGRRPPPQAPAADADEQ